MSDNPAVSLSADRFQQREIYSRLAALALPHEAAYLHRTDSHNLTLTVHCAHPQHVDLWARRLNVVGRISSRGGEPVEWVAVGEIAGAPVVVTTRWP